MALNINAVWEVRTTGSDNNGGAFRTGASGSDFSQQDAAQATLTAASVVHSTTTQINVAIGDYTVTNDDVGNHLNITGGTATAGVYEITVVDIPNNRWTVDRAVGTVGQTVVGAMGGAMASPGRVFQFFVTNNILYIKAGTYTITTTSTNVSNGCLNRSAATFIEGYETTRGDLGTAPLLQADGVITLFTIATLSNSVVFNVDLDCNNRTTSRGYLITSGYIYKCKVSNATNEGYQLSSNSMAAFCEATGCSLNPAIRLQASGAQAFYCYSHDNTQSGFSLASGTTCSNCIADTNTGGTTDGFIMIGAARCINCSSYGNGREGFRISATSCFIVNCISENNATWGYRDSTNINGFALFNNAGFNNPSGNVDMGTGKFNRNVNFITGSASFFTDPGNGDFSLNSSAGGGALARNAGMPGLFPGSNTTGFEDVGAVQHEDSGGGGGASSAVLHGANVIPYRSNYY